MRENQNIKITIEPFYMSSNLGKMEVFHNFAPYCVFVEITEIY